MWMLVLPKNDFNEERPGDLQPRSVLLYVNLTQTPRKRKARTHLKTWAITLQVQYFWIFLFYLEQEQHV